MSLRLAGLGWVTPLGCTIDEVWAKLLTGAEAEESFLATAAEHGVDGADQVLERRVLRHEAVRSAPLRQSRIVALVARGGKDHSWS